MEKKKNIKLLVIGLLVLVAFSFGASYAYFVSRINKEGEGSHVGGSTATKEDTVVSTTGSIGFSDTDIYPGHKNISKIIVTATGEDHVIYNLVWNGTNTLNTTLNYKVYKTTSEESPTVTCTKKESGTLVKEYYEECTENLTGLGEIISSGEIKSSDANNKVKLVKNEEIDATTAGAKVYYYIVLEYPNKEDSQNIDMNGSFTGNINVELLEKKDLNASETLLAKNEMVHETYTNEENELIDVGYRYQGANPKNYVTFNNELWRIISVEEGSTIGLAAGEQYLKITRNEKLTEISWNHNGIASWQGGDIMPLLNGEYLNKSGLYISTGLTNESRTMIAEAKWYLGVVDRSSSTTQHMHSYERKTSAEQIWIGKVGLMYPSDYGYAAPQNICANSEMSYMGYECIDKNWLTKHYFRWTITPADGNYAFCAYSGSALGICNISENRGIEPVIYLESNVSIVDGDGSIDYPYELELS